MKRSYVKSKQWIDEILEHKEEGKTNREIGQLYGLNSKQVKNLIYRHRSILKKAVDGSISVRRKGRPRSTAMTTKEDFESEINRLTMENELLKNFLQSIGRR
jgi:transposase